MKDIFDGIMFDTAVSTLVYESPDQTESLWLTPWGEHFAVEPRESGRESIICRFREHGPFVWLQRRGLDELSKVHFPKSYALGDVVAALIQPVSSLGLSNEITEKLISANQPYVGDVAYYDEGFNMRNAKLSKSDIEGIRAALYARGLKFDMSIGWSDVKKYLDEQQADLDLTSK